jgi:hypothetical protein
MECTSMCWFNFPTSENTVILYNTFFHVANFVPGTVFYIIWMVSNVLARFSISMDLILWIPHSGLNIKHYRQVILYQGNVKLYKIGKVHRANRDTGAQWTPKKVLTGTYERLRVVGWAKTDELKCRLLLVPTPLHTLALKYHSALKFVDRRFFISSFFSIQNRCYHIDVFIACCTVSYAYVVCKGQKQMSTSLSNYVRIWNYL